MQEIDRINNVILRLEAKMLKILSNYKNKYCELSYEDGEDVIFCSDNINELKDVVKKLSANMKG